MGIFFFIWLAYASSPETVRRVLHGDLTARLVYDLERGPVVEGESDMIHLIGYEPPEEGVFKSGESVQAVGARCTDTARALASWRRSHQPASCDVTALVPPRIARLLGVFRYGANCFNAALYVAGLTEQLRVTSDDELVTSLHRHCRARDAAPRAGDVAVIWVSEHGRRAPLHAFTYIGKDLAFEKPNLGVHEPYRFLEPVAILKQWNVPEVLRFAPWQARERLLAQWPGGIYAEAYDCSSSSMIW